MPPRKSGPLAAVLLLTASLVAAQPAQAKPHPVKPVHPKHSAGVKDKLGQHDRDLLVKAVREGKKNVTTMIAVTPERFADARKAVEAAGGNIGASNAKVGYLRATLPPGAIDALAQKDSVLAVDLSEEIKLGDPAPAAERSSSVKAKAPDANTPLVNAYMPIHETGAAAFATAYPQWDGRGVTIGVLDSGVDLDHPALATTTTGERKIVDWVTATDPVSEGDGTWLKMTTKVNAVPTFKSGGKTYTAPASGEFLFNRFNEYVTQGDNEVNGDVNRDGDGSDSWGVLYRASDHAIWVDSDNDGLFTDETLMRPYREANHIGHFGVMPFVVEHRAVDTTEYVNIGLPAGSHGTHVAGIAAGRGLLGGKMTGAAPGAKIVSSRACTWQGGCTNVALTEGMIDLVANRGVDVVNMSIGGLPALNDGANARTYLYNALIRVFGVQIFISAGNSGPGLNTVGDPSTASDVVSVGASVSRETWAANYGNDVATRMGIFNFSSRGPREDGGFKPNIVAPGAAVSSINTWLAGEAVPDSGYQLPAGYGMFNGTSMASPQATGAAALLLSAAKASKVDASPVNLRNAIYNGARLLDGVPVHEQGYGLFNVDAAWKALGTANTYKFDAPVCTPISDYLPTAGRGEGIYDRCVGAADRFQDVTVTRTSGPAGDLQHKVSWIGETGTFKNNPDSVKLPLGVPVTIRVHVKARGNGAHSAIMVLDNPGTSGRDAGMMATIVVADDFTGPGFTRIHSGQVAKAQATSYFVNVPENAKTMQVKLASTGRVKFTAQHPYGVPFEAGCYTNMTTEGCNPEIRSFKDPIPGIWEITVEAARSSDLERNPFRLDVAIFGVSASDPVKLGVLDLHQPADVSWQATNHFGPVDLAASSSPLASRMSARPTIEHDGVLANNVNVPIGTKRLEVRIGNPSDKAADLDLLVTVSGILIGYSADGDSEESVVIEDPPAGTYTIYIDGYAVPSGSTEFDYFDEIRTATLGKVTTTFAAPLNLAHQGTAQVTAKVVASGMAPAGRQVYGTLDLTSTTGAIVGQTEVSIEGVNGPTVQLRQKFGPMLALDFEGDVVSGSVQYESKSVPSRWTAADGMKRYDGYEGHIFTLNGVGDGVGQSEHTETPTLPGVFRADGTVTELPIVDWDGKNYIYGRAFAINNAGTVVGNMTSFDYSNFKWTNDPYSWTPTGGYVRLQHLSADAYMSEPLAINSSGMIVGQSMKDGVLTACWWSSDGQIHEIGGDGALYSINESGVAVGEHDGRAAMWTVDGGWKPLSDHGFFSKALAVNASGWVIGNADAGPWDTHAVVWDPQGNMYDLSALNTDETFYIVESVGLNDAGDFVVYGYSNDESTHAVLRLS